MARQVRSGSDEITYEKFCGKSEFGHFVFPLPLLFPNVFMLQNTHHIELTGHGIKRNKKVRYIHKKSRFRETADRMIFTGWLARYTAVVPSE